jgi:sugar transferase (PEP-CTERM/EpsH1 system associated)
MRIVWLNAGLLLPLDKGGRLRSWHLLRHLARRHSVTYLGFSDPSASVRDMDGMLEACDDLQTVERREVPKASLAFYLDAARHLADPLPYAVAKYRSAEYRHRLEALVAPDRCDALVCDFLVPAVNMPARIACPTVLFTHNVEAEIWRRHAETEERAWRRALLRSQWRRMLSFERRTLARFDAVLAVSESDRDTFARLYGESVRSPVCVIPTGVDVEYFAPDPSVRPDPFHIVFTGSMDWLPNEDAIVHFCREILPRLRQAEPRVSIAIVGRNPTPAVRRLAERDRGIEVTGRVDDVRPHVARGALSIVPLRVGGGTRLKIYESMAMGRAVVSTTVGAEGLPLTPGVHVTLADEPDHFAAEVLRLLRDGAARRAIEEAGLRLVRERYDWGAAAGVFERAIQSAADAHAAARLERSEARPAVMPALSSPAGVDHAAGPVAGRRIPS